MPALALEYTYAYSRPSALLPDGRRHCLSLVTGRATRTGYAILPWRRPAPEANR